NSVCPSDGPLATADQPITPAPPVLFSTTVVPSLMLSSWPTMRPRVSVVPPGATGTTMLIVLEGKLWAATGDAARQLRLPATNSRLVSFIGASQQNLSLCDHA